MGQDLADIIIADRHIFFGLAQHFVDGSDSFLKIIDGALFTGDDLLPVPLIHVDRVNVVCCLVSADGAHICVEPFTMCKTVFLQRHALPLRQRVNDFRLRLVLLFDAEGNGTLHTVQVIVQTGSRIHEKRCGYAQQVQLFR